MFDNPYPVAQRLREADPVHWSKECDAWVLTRHADVTASLQDPRFAADRLPPLSRLSAFGMEDLRPLFGLMRQMLTFIDPPSHTRLRRLANRGFTRPIVEGWRASTRQTVDALLDAADSRGTMDVVADLAKPLSRGMISAVLGIPASERVRLGGWSDAMGRFFGYLRHSNEQLIDVQASIVEFAEYLRHLMAHLRRQPDAGAGLLSVLARDAGESLSEDELLATAILLVGAGTVTTADLIGNAMLALLRHPAHAALIRRPDAPADLIGTAVEELLRYDSPVQMTGRLLVRDVELAGRHLRRGQRAVLWLGAANHDPARFAAPDTLDFDRPDNRHLSFGGGAHFCLGAPLARLQAQTAIAGLLTRFPAIRLAEEPVEWQRFPTLRGPASLTVHLH